MLPKFKIVILSVLVALLSKTKAQVYALDSLLSVLKTQKEDTNKVRILIKISESYQYGKNDHPNGIHYAKLGIELSNKLNYEQGRYDSYWRLARIYHNEAKADKAVENYLKCLRIAEQMNNETTMAYIYLYMQGIYHGMQDYKNAIAYNEKAFEIWRRQNDSGQCAVAMVNIGSVYQRSGNNDNALLSLKKALDLDGKNAYIISWAEYFIGESYRAKGLMDTAFKDYEDAYILFKATNNLDGLAESCLGLSYTYLAKQKLDLSLEKANEGYNLHLKNNSQWGIRDAALLLSKIYRQKKQFEKYLFYSDLYATKRDSISNVEMSSRVAFEQNAFTSEQAAKIQKIEEEKKQVIADAEKRKNNLLLLLAFAIATAAAIVAFVILRSLKITRKQKTMIEIKNKEIEQKQKEIIDSITYARRIQKALITSEKYIQSRLDKLNKS